MKEEGSVTQASTSNRHSGQGCHYTARRSRVRDTGLSLRITLSVSSLHVLPTFTWISFGCTGLVPPSKVSSEWRRHSGCFFHFHLATSSNKMCNDSKPALPFPFSVERAEILTKLLLQCHESHSRELAVVKSESARVRRLDLEQRERRKRRKRATQGRDERGSFTALWREGKRLCQAVSELSQSSSEAPRGDGRLNALLTSQ